MESRSPASNSNSKASSKHSIQYLCHLKALNNQVLAWLKMHIESNPLVILSPVFKDYETHLEEINTKYGADSPSAEASQPAPQEKTIAVSEPAKPFSFGSFSAAPTTSSTAAAASPFSFGSSSSPAATKVENPTSSAAPTPAPAFSFS